MHSKQAGGFSLLQQRLVRSEQTDSRLPGLLTKPHLFLLLLNRFPYVKKKKRGPHHRGAPRRFFPFWFHFCPSLDWLWLVGWGGVRPMWMVALGSTKLLSIGKEVGVLCRTAQTQFSDLTCKEITFFF